MSLKIRIPHLISETHKEIYVFENHHQNVWYYVGCYDARRNDENDIFGDEWEEFYEKEEREKLEKIAKKFHYKDFEEAVDDISYDCFSEISKEVELIYNYYNPVLRKTNDGKPYYGGTYWGIGGNPIQKELHKPKLSKEEIAQKILDYTSKIEVKF